jgi:predicted protein tyrosine phosphatase
MSLTVLPLKSARERYREFDGIISIEDVHSTDGLRVPAASLSALPAGPPPFDMAEEGEQDGAHQLVLAFEDLDEDRHGAATHQQIVVALAFARLFRDRKLLVHCVKGQARSPALALAILADRLGPGREREAVVELLYIRPDDPHDILGPNLHVLKLADAILERKGALFQAWMAYEAIHWNDKRSQYRYWRMEAPRLLPADGTAAEVA